MLSEINRGDVIEFQGVRSSGGQHFLSFLAMTAVLPNTYQLSRRITATNGELHAEIKFGGKNQTVVWIDTSGAFDVDRLAIMLRGHIANTIGAANLGIDTLEREEEIVEEIVVECLERVTVYSPRSTIQMACAVAAIESTYMNSLTVQQEIGYVFIDSVSEFTWFDILEKETNSSSPSLTHLIAALTRLRNNLAPIFVLSQWVLKSNLSHLSRDKLPFYSNHLPPPWPTILIPPATPGSRHFGLTTHITLHPPKMKFVPAGVGLEAAMKLEKTEEVYTAVLRARGGQEIGSWQYNLSPTGIQ